MASLRFAEGFAMLRQTTRQRVNKTTSRASQGYALLRRLRDNKSTRQQVGCAEATLTCSLKKVYKKSNQKKQKESTRSLVVS